VILLVDVPMTWHAFANSLASDLVRLYTIYESVAKVAKSSQPFGMFHTKSASNANCLIINRFATYPDIARIEWSAPIVECFQWNTDITLFTGRHVSETEQEANNDCVENVTTE